MGVGTAASFTKLYYLAFIKKPLVCASANIKANDKRTLKSIIPMYTALALICICMLIIGIRPNALLNIIAIPAIRDLGMPIAANSHQMSFNFWNTSDIFSIFLTLILGVLVCGIGLKTGAFSFHPKKRFTLEGIAAYLYNRALCIIKRLFKIYAFITAGFFAVKKKIKKCAAKQLLRLDKSRTFNLGRTVLIGISADAGIIVLALLALIAGFTLMGLLL